MYTTNYNPTFAHDDVGVYGPKAHQRVISKLNSGLGPLYYSEGKLTLEPLPETMLNDGEASRSDGPPAPDLILYDNEARIALSLKCAILTGCAGIFGR